MSTATQTGIVAQIVKAERTYITAQKRRQQALARLSGMNCAFADIHNRLLNEAKAEGFYSTDAELEKAKKDRKDWAVQLFQFIDWVYRTYSNYNEVIRKEKDVVKKGAIAPKVVKTKEGATLTKERAGKILEKVENLPVLNEALDEKGLVVVPKKLGEKEVEDFLADPENKDMILKVLVAKGII